MYSYPAEKYGQVYYTEKTIQEQCPWIENIVLVWYQYKNEMCLNTANSTWFEQNKNNFNIKMSFYF